MIHRRDVFAAVGLLTGVTPDRESPFVSKWSVLIVDSGVSTPILIVTAEGKVEIPQTRAQLEEIVKTSKQAGYAQVALEILRLRTKCGEPLT